MKRAGIAARLCLLVMMAGPSTALYAGTIDELIASGHLRVASTINPVKGIVPGQKISLTLENATDRWFAGGTRISIPEVPGLVILQTEQFASNASEPRNGQTWVVQRWTLDVYPQRTGDFKIPPIKMRVTVNAGDAGEVEGDVYSPATAFTVAIPAALTEAQQWVAAPHFDVRQSFDRNLQELVVGDAFEQEVTFEATDVMAMMLPNFAPPSPAGLATYPSPAVLNNSSNRGESTASRTVRISYIAEEPGQYLLPASDYFWWDTTTGKLRLLSLPETHIAVTGTTAATHSGKTSLDVSPRQMLVTLSGLALFAALLWLARRVLPRLPLDKLRTLLSALATQLSDLRKPALASRLNPGSSAED